LERRHGFVPELKTEAKMEVDVNMKSWLDVVQVEEKRAKDEAGRGQSGRSSEAGEAEEERETAEALVAEIVEVEEAN
jgi:hypothetical protein